MIINNKFKTGDIVKVAYYHDEEHMVVTDISLIYSVVSRDGVTHRCVENELFMVKKKCLHTTGYYPTGQQYLSEYVQYKYCPDCGESLQNKEKN